MLAESPIQAIDRVASEKLSARVVHSLALYIIGAGSEEGFALPPEPKLCRRLEVSRTVLREAVKVLEAKGLVDVGHGQGMVARPRRKWNHLDPDVFTWQCEAGGDERFVRDLGEFRRIVEPAAAELTAERASEEEVVAIRQSYARMEEAAREGEAAAYIAADLEFHNAIVAACGNHLLARMTQSIGGALRMSRDISIRVASGWAGSLPLHKALAEAIAMHDPAAARAASTVIIRAAERDVAAVLNSSAQFVPGAAEPAPTRP